MATDRWLIHVEDVRNWSAFAARLRNSKDSLTCYLRSTFTPHTRRLLREYRTDSTPTRELRDGLLHDLNDVIAGSSIYDPVRFAQVELTVRSERLAGRNPKHCLQLNRLLLAEAYGRELNTGWKTASRDWHKFQIEKYDKEFAHYQAYADTLSEILQKVCRACGVPATVEARAKSVSSFAEKAIRKAFKYDAPIHQITDLCGARVIVSTLEAARCVCEAIRNSGFIVDEANSLDQRTQLKPKEFGYLAYHYVIQLPSGSILGTAIPDAIGERKAEIQVQTRLQNAWQLVTHDTVYKAPFDVPERWERELSAAAAFLEKSDGVFQEALDALKQYEANYGAYMTPEQMTDEITALRTILANEPVRENKPGIALRIAKVAKAAWDWNLIEKQLSPYLKTSGHEHAEILMEHGHALCRINMTRNDGAERNHYARGQKELKLAATEGKGGIRSRALSYLGWSFGNIPGHEREAHEQYKEAFGGDPRDPYILASYLEYELFLGLDRAALAHMRPAILEAINVCRAHADARLELPWAFLAMGRFYLLLRQYYDSLAQYAKAVQLCTSGAACMPEDALDAEREFLNRINLGKALPPGDLWVDLLLLLAKSVTYHKTKPAPGIMTRARRARPFTKPIVVVAGGTDPTVEKEMQQYKECLFAAFDDFHGTIISGGTNAGIPGLVGRLREHLEANGQHDFRLIGYVPEKLLKHIEEGTRYHELPTTASAETDFTPHEPLQSWIDLIAQGVNPSDVRVFGINGGSIAAFEYKLALALGATVGVIETSGRAVADLMPDADWWNMHNLLWLPSDPMVARALVNPGTAEMTPAQLDQSGQAIHEKFLEDNRYRRSDPAMKPWSDLREDIKESNRQQAAYAAEVLRRHDYGVRHAIMSPSKIVPLEFVEYEIETMAEMEHGRWVVERLSSGWRYGSVRDPDRKISPYLVPWKDLTPEVQDYDRRVITDWPKLMAEAGLEVYRL